MNEVTISLADEQIRFLSECKKYGFKNKNNIIGTALDNLRKELGRKNLEKSANLYAEIYYEDSEIKELTESAIA